MVAFERRDRNRLKVRDAARVRECSVFLDDTLEHVLRVAGQVHLVHGQQHVTDAHERENPRVPPRLRKHAFARIDEDYGEIGG